MKPVVLHAKATIEAFLRQSTSLHLYEIGDLEDLFWPYTIWYGEEEQGQLRQLVLVYTGESLPVVLALGEPPHERLAEFLRALRPILPPRFYAHLSDDLGQALAVGYQVESHGLHHKMILADRSRLEAFDISEIVRLTMEDLEPLQALYAVAYPGNWFLPHMLASAPYYGLYRGGELVSVAGVHVYSPTYRVAALGNITTHPAQRGQGLATAVVARLCRALYETVDQIGLNVKADNAGAIACYTKLGFQRVADYTAYVMALRP